jgi:hypothetical protein
VRGRVRRRGRAAGESGAVGARALHGEDSLAGAFLELKRAALHVLERRRAAAALLPGACTPCERPPSCCATRSAARPPAAQAAAAAAQARGLGLLACYANAAYTALTFLNPKGLFRRPLPAAARGAGGGGGASVRADDASRAPLRRRRCRC